MRITTYEMAIAKRMGSHFLPPGGRDKPDDMVMRKRGRQGERKTRYKLNGEGISVAEIAKLAGIGTGKANDLLLCLPVEQVIAEGKEWKVNKRTKQVLKCCD